MEDTQNIATVHRTSRKKRNGWKVVALLEAFLLIGGSASVLVYEHNKDSVAAVNQNKDHLEVVDTDLLQTQKEDGIATKRLCDHLDTLILEFQASNQTGFHPEVIQLFGYEYLMFSNGTIKVYFRNEVPETEKTSRQMVMIDNGIRMVEYTWDYDFEKGLRSLCPYFGDFFDNGEEQIIFITYEDNQTKKIPSLIRAISADSLWEYETLDLAEEMNDAFSTEYNDKGSDSNHPDIRMKLMFGPIAYTYRISNEHYVNAVYYDETIIKQDRYFELNVTNDKITVASTLYLSDQEYLGEFTATLGLSSNQMELMNPSFAAYVPANQEDPSLEGVIVPRKERLSEDRINLWGNKGERYLVELSKEVERSKVLQENLHIQEDGTITAIAGVKQMLSGIDVSKFQGDIDWKKVEAFGIDFAMIRVGFRGFGEGTLELDPYFKKNMDGIKNTKLGVGAYFFSQAITVEEAKEEAEFVLKQLKGYHLDYPVVVDTEHVSTYPARANQLSRQERTDIVKTFCEIIKEAGYEPMIYANTKWMVMGIDLSQLKEYKLWFAYYGKNLSFPYHFSMYQYSDHGMVDGIKGPVDKNVYFK